MIPLRAAWVLTSIACTCATVAYGIIGYVHVAPGTPVAIHFDFDGRANGYAGPAFAFANLAVASAVVTVSGLVTRTFLERQGRHVERGIASVVLLGVNVLVTLGQIYIVRRALGA